MTISNPIPPNSLIRPPNPSDTLLTISRVLHFISDSCLNSADTLDAPTDARGAVGLHIVLEEVLDALDYVINCVEEDEEEEEEELDQKGQKARKKGRGGR